MAEKFLYKREVYEIQGHIYAVRNELGAGWSEHIYHHALVRRLKDAGVLVESKPRKALRHRGQTVHIFEPDLIAWRKIILELKVLPYQTSFPSEHIAQLLHYLKFYSMSLGLLVNLAPAKVRTRRIIWEEPRLRIRDNWEAAVLFGDNDSLAQRLKSILIFLGETFGLGYSDAIYRRLLLIELAHQGMSFQKDVEVPARWQGKTIALHRTLFIAVEKTCLIHLTALPRSNAQYDLTRMHSYLKNLGFPFGILANFSPRQLQLNLILPT